MLAMISAMILLIPILIFAARLGFGILSDSITTYANYSAARKSCLNKPVIGKESGIKIKTRTYWLPQDDGYSPWIAGAGSTFLSSGTVHYFCDEEEAMKKGYCRDGSSSLGCKE